MNIEIHPDARRCFDELAEEVLRAIEPGPELFSQRATSTFEPARHVSAHLDETMIRDLTISPQDGRMLETGRFFLVPGIGLRGLSGAGYEAFRNLVARVSGQKPLKPYLSEKAVDDLLFRWLRSRYKEPQAVSPGQNTVGAAEAGLAAEAAQPPEQGGTLTSFLLTEAPKLIAAHEIWLPIATLCIEEPLALGDVVLRPIGPEQIDQWTAHWANAPEAKPDEVESARDRLRKQIQGLAAATITVNAEPRRAEEIAIEAGEAAVSMLRLFSAEILHPYACSLCSIEGLTELGGSVVITLRDGVASAISRFAPRGLKSQWKLSKAEVEKLLRVGLAEANNLLNLREPTPFQELLRHSLRHYSIAALKKDPAEKLLYIVTALEALLLGGPDEGSITQNLRERFAIIRETDRDARRRVLARVTQVYGERSRFVHGGVRPADLELLQEFMLDSAEVFGRLLRAHTRFASRSELLELLEAHKMAGPAFGRLVFAPASPS
jgi:hypothetical protein